MESLQANDPVAIGRYRLLARLGAGGMGLVYLGADDAGRQVAIKVVHPGFAHDDQFRARFAREVAVSRKVTGPWTAAVVDADPNAPTPWLATEYVPGQSLDTVIRTFGVLAPRAVHDLAVGLAKALVTIHDAGLIHRDIKPSNVLMSADGPRLIDFGISRAVDGTRMTSTGMVIGTPAFMSPEQTEGDDIGPASDVFSLGAVLVLAATGVGPFGEGTPMVLLRRILTTEPNLGALVEPVRGVVAECVRLDVAQRPTAAQLVERLEPVPVPPSTKKMTAVLPAETAIDVRGAEPAPPRSPVRRRALFVGAGAVLAGFCATPFLIGGTPSGMASGMARRTARWTYEVPAPLTAVVATDDIVYVAADQTVTALDGRTGTVRWSWSWYDPVDRLAVSGADLAVGIGGLTLVLNGSNKSARWGDKPGGSLAGVTDRLVMLDDVREGATVLAARDTATGEERWSQPQSRSDWGRMSHSRAVSSGAAHFSFLDRLDTIDTATGELRWSRPVPPKSYGDSMAVLGDLLCVVEFPDSKGAHLQALGAATGAERWRQPCNRASDLASDGRFIYQASDAGVVARRPDTGDVQWSASFQRGFSVLSSIAAAANGPVVLGANTGVADLIAVLDGQSTWTFRGDVVKVSDQLFGPLIVGRSAIVGAGTKVYSVALD